MKRHIDKIAFSILFATVLVVLNILYSNHVSKTSAERGRTR